LGASGSNLAIGPEDPSSPDAVRLMAELSAVLAAITGDDGLSSFGPDDVRAPRSCFLVARDDKGRAVGCGALRPLDGAAAEIKRMYAAPGGSGVGAALLYALEREAAALGYHVIRLSTRIINTRAVSFYERHGYRLIPNFGRYKGREESACFEKQLVHQE
jgi:ribosomal protein S18 acetylase RimI-like enzyme